MSGAQEFSHHDRVNGFLARFAADRNIEVHPLNENGVSQVQRGSAVVSIHVVPEQGVLLLLSKVLTVPTQGREALYRRLLEASFLATGDAAFSIQPDSDEVFLRALRGLEGLDFDEFEDLLHTIATVADAWDDQLKSEFSS